VSVVKAELVPVERIQQMVLFVRGQRVMIDADLAILYGVATRVLNQAVRRNAGRFPIDFMFQLTPAEKVEVITACDHLQTLKYSSSLPFAFTRADLYELRVDATTRSFRMLFSAEGRSSQVLLSLSTFVKKTQKTPPRELEFAEGRLRDWRKRARPGRTP
jgi:phage-related protein